MTATGSRIINMAQGLQIEVVAEGIEQRVAQATELRALGCRLAQGYLYARPLPAHEITALLDSRLPVAASVTTSARPLTAATRGSDSRGTVHGPPPLTTRHDQQPTRS